MNKTFYIETFGCQMNKSDSESMMLSLLENGFQQGRTPLDADILIFNTCSVREHAENRVLSRLESFKKDFRRKHGTVIIAGCMAQRIGTDLIKKGTAHLVIGPYQSPDIGTILKQFLRDRSVNTYLSQDARDLKNRIGKGLLKIKGDFPWHKWVTITHGCENHCTYCIVPSVRGRLISFPSGEIIQYINDCAGEGITEITLLGQNVNQYGIDSGDISFASLLEKAAQTPGLQRINFITSHPKDFTAEIINVIRDYPVISRAIHLPLQSGSDAILKDMNRQYTMDHYMRIIEQIDSRLNNYSLSTDLIVGFPGERRDDFNATLAAVQKIKFDNAFMYAYSPRSGTPAWFLGDSIPRQKKIERLQELIAIQRDISREKMMRRIDCIEEVIIQRISKKSQSQVMGLTFLDHPVIMPGTVEDIGKKVTIKIDSLSGSTLQGQRIEHVAN